MATSPPKFSNSCFSCKKTDHWFKDCPDRKAKRSSLSNSESSFSLMEVPVVQCPCGNGACRISTSHTRNNPHRKFYSFCQVSNHCGFFQWVDEVIELGAPRCPCGAGACSLNRAENGYWFFSCRIKKGHGACSFFRWADSPVNSRMNKRLHLRTPLDKDFEAIIKPPQSPRKDSQLSNGISEDHARQNDAASSSILRNFGQGLLNILEDESLVDREKMLTIAETTFVALRSLSINISSFSEHVMKYIDCKSRLAILENSMSKSCRSELNETSMEKERKQLKQETKTTLDSAKAEVSFELNVCVKFAAVKKEPKYEAFYVCALVPIVAFSLYKIISLLSSWD